MEYPTNQKVGLATILRQKEFVDILVNPLRGTNKGTTDNFKIRASSTAENVISLI